MRSKPKTPTEAAALRRRAEAQLQAVKEGAQTPRTAAGTQRLLHELQVHQIELELQNEELRQARDELDASLDRYTALYENAPVGYLTLDREGTIRAVNLTGATLLGVVRAALVGTAFRRFLAPDAYASFQALLATVFATPGTHGVCEVPLLATATPKRYVRIEARVTDAGDECRAVLVDITDSKRLEEERLLRTTLEATSVLAAGIAHDFNNLLMVILGSLELLGEPGEDPAAHHAAAIQATLEARGLIQQFLAFAKGGRPDRKALVLGGVIQAAVTLSLRGTPVACDLSLPPDLWPVDGDATQLGQVFRNLLQNARDAMPAGGRIAVRAENVAGPPPAVRVTLVDAGAGIPADVLPKIFNPYFSTKPRGTQRGMGLGLTVCRAIVQQRGGTLTVDSTVGTGTTVQLVLPAVPGGAPAAPPPPPHFPPGTGRLLVMDDEPAVRRTLGALLRRQGYTVELAAHGEEAVTLYQAAQARGEAYTAVVLDVTVREGLGGVPTLEALRRLDPTVVAIAVSGYADDPVITDPGRFGFQGALAKPHGIAALRELLARVLGD